MQLNKFLVKAKTSTYANQRGIKERVLKDGARQFTFEMNNLYYRDRYYGFTPFIGEEIVWKDGKVIWSMNYYGKLLSNVFFAKDVYKFLKMALQKVKEDKPFRGPDIFKIGNFKYINKPIGNINYFSGTEKIFFKDKEIYNLIYHGGSVSSK